MRVLVTGAAGFLGQATLVGLREGGHDAVGLDIKDADWIIDITEPMWVPTTGLDAVVHMAAIAAPRTCEVDPGLAYDVNVNGTHQVLKLAVEADAKKFVFISSAHVYGISPRYLPTDEQHPLHPQETYTTTKILGEKLCELYHENYGLSYTTLRLFNAYGPGQLPGYFIPDIIAKAKDGGINSLKGGWTTKDFVYVDDVVKAILAAIETPFVGPVNIGTGEQSELHHVAYVISQTLGTDLHSDPMDGPDTATQMQADWSRARRVLGWEPTVDLAEGLRATIKAS